MHEITTLAGLAIITEALIEYITYKLPKTICPSWVKLYSGMLVGVILCLVYGRDLMPLIGLQAIPIVGPVVTGLLIGRGSNIANDLFKKLQIVQVPAADATKVIAAGVLPTSIESARPAGAAGSVGSIDDARSAVMHS